MPWLLPILAACQILGAVAADAGWMSIDLARALAVAAAGAGALARRRARWIAAAAAGLAFSAGALALAARLDPALVAESIPDAEVTVEATVAEVERRDSGFRVELEDVAAVNPPPAWQPLPFPRRLRLYGQTAPDGVPDLAARFPGERIRARVRLRSPARLRNPGSRGGLRDLRRAGIGAQGRLVHPALHVRLPDREGVRPGAALHAARAALAARLAPARDASGLLRALALGDRSRIDPELRESFARLGLAHLLAVSGLHLAGVAALTFGAARAGLRRVHCLAARFDTRAAALLAAGLIATLYALLCGFGVPVRRALVLLAALGLGYLRGRPRAALTALAAAAIFVAADDPAEVFRPGAQLSFAASWALVLAVRRDPRGAAADGGAAPRALRGALRTTASAIAVTAPVAAWHLGRSAPWALPVNLVAIPWTAFAMLPAAALALLAAALPHGPATAAVLAACAGVARITARAVEGAAGVLPPAGRSGDFPASVWLLLAALALASAGARRTRTRVALALAVCTVIAWAPPRAWDPPVPRLVVLDVGQGDASLVQSRGAAVLVDAGTAHPAGSDRGATVVLPALAALGVRELALVVVTHADLDHRGGVPAVLHGISVGEVWLPHGAIAEPAFDAIRATARRRGVPVRERGEGAAAFDAGDLRVVPLWPPRRGVGSRNDRSLVVRVEVAGRRVLLPGDVEVGAERALVERGADLRADVLALAHHGSRTSSSAAFLAAVDPDVAIAQAPCAGRFGMPHPPVVRRLLDLGTSLWWTGRDGAVRVGLGPRLTAGGTAHADGVAAQPCPPARGRTGGRL